MALPLKGEEVKPADPAELLRQQGDFLRAEDMINARIEANPQDAEAYKILGDIKVSRGQAFRKKWDKNLGKAVEAYTKAVVIEPSNCTYWGRVAFVVSAAAESPETQLSGEALDQLPLEQGWFDCPGAALLAIEEARPLAEGAMAQAQRSLGADATRYQLEALTHPKLVEGYKKVPLAQLPWKEPAEELEPKPGLYFVVLEGPVKAKGMDNAQPRTVDGPEWMKIARVDAGEIVFTDTKTRAKAREQGVVTADACPGTSWSIGSDGGPLGYCAAGPFNPSRSAIYDPGRLKIASGTHYHQPSIVKSVVDGDMVVQGSVSCLGGPVGRLFVEKATCSVQYYRAASQQRRISTAAGTVVPTREEAVRQVDAFGMGAVYGVETGRNLAKGSRPLGLPWTLVDQLETDMFSCTGRRLFQRAWFKDDGIEFYCTDGRNNYKFRDMVYVGLEKTQGS
ncbi:MAG: hypothetical protein JXX28_13645 [Deltaproteobacteria bacterium]|nr:hypothetical protein [Deltaproteobacteria bacterium]